MLHDVAQIRFRLLLYSIMLLLCFVVVVQTLLEPHESLEHLQSALSQLAGAPVSFVKSLDLLFYLELFV